MKEPSPFTDKLYDHSFDIDDILVAFCGEKPVYLNTLTGVIEESVSTISAKHFLIEPLPHSFIQEIIDSPKKGQLSPEDFNQVKIWLENATILDLPHIFEQGFSGGWVRERVKDVALEWLDMNGLIPPSMRHVRDSSHFSDAASMKIKIKL